jgi:hypothetical protein
MGTRSRTIRLLYFILSPAVVRRRIEQDHQASLPYTDLSPADDKEED